MKKMKNAHREWLDGPIAAAKRVSNKRAMTIPQHRLLSKAEWDRLRKHKIKKFSYWATKGPLPISGIALHDSRFTVTIEDAP